MTFLTTMTPIFSPASYTDFSITQSGNQLLLKADGYTITQLRTYSQRAINQIWNRHIQPLHISLDGTEPKKIWCDLTEIHSSLGLQTKKEKEICETFLKNQSDCRSIFHRLISMYCQKIPPTYHFLKKSEHQKTYDDLKEETLSFDLLHLFEQQDHALSFITWNHKTHRFCILHTPSTSTSPRDFLSLRQDHSQTWELLDTTAQKIFQSSFFNLSQPTIIEFPGDALMTETMFSMTCAQINKSTASHVSSIITSVLQQLSCIIMSRCAFPFVRKEDLCLHLNNDNLYEGYFRPTLDVYNQDLITRSLIADWESIRLVTPQKDLEIFYKDLHEKNISYDNLRAMNFSDRSARFICNCALWTFPSEFSFLESNSKTDFFSTWLKEGFYHQKIGTSVDEIITQLQRFMLMSTFYSLLKTFCSPQFLHPSSSHDPRTSDNKLSEVASWIQNGLLEYLYSSKEVNVVSLDAYKQIISILIHVTPETVSDKNRNLFGLIPFYFMNRHPPHSIAVHITSLIKP